MRYEKYPIYMRYEKCIESRRFIELKSVVLTIQPKSHCWTNRKEWKNGAVVDVWGMSKRVILGTFNDEHYQDCIIDI